MLRHFIPPKDTRRKLKPTGFIYRGYFGQTAVEAIKAWNDVWQTPAYSWEGFVSRIKYTPGVNWFVFQSGTFHDAT